MALQRSYDVVIVGGAVMGSSAAYFLSENPNFTGSILVVEPDSSYENAQTTRAQNSIREQFSQPVNIQISQFGMDFIDNFHENTQVDGEAPLINFRGTGYLFLSEDPDHLAVLDRDSTLQRIHGAEVRMLAPGNIAEEFPFLDTSTLVGARMGSLREGSFDGWSLLQGFRSRAEHNGVTYVTDRVVQLVRGDGGRITSVGLESGRSVSCGYVVNAAGPRARLIAGMVGLELPVEPRARTSFVFDCATEIPHNVPLIITPEGVHFRREQHHYMTGAVPLVDTAVEYDDLAVRRNEFEDLIWPVLAKYVPQFDQVKVITSWGGQYAYNVLDHNLVIGAGSLVPNLIFANGFSGHGLQQAPAVGRGISELVAYGEFRTIDMTALGYERIQKNEAFLENVVI